MRLTACLLTLVLQAGALGAGPATGTSAAKGADPIALMRIDGLPAHGPSLAFEACRSLAVGGDLGAQALLASRYYLGEGVTADLAQAVVWYQKAAQGGDPKAQTVLAMLYEDGEGVPRDAAVAAQWFRKAAEQGDLDAQARLGGKYYRGEGVPRDLVEARAWFRKAADQGDTEAQAKLGAMCFQGEGLARDAGEAALWFRKAAELGDPYAQGCLGVMYALGDGVPKDPVAAYALLLQAKAGGNAEAARSSELVVKELTPVQKREGELRAGARSTRAPLAPEAHEPPGDLLR